VPVGDHSIDTYKDRKIVVPIAMMYKSICGLTILALAFAPLVAAQDQDSATAQQKSSPVGRGIDHLFNNLNMAGTAKASEFQPLTQRERTQIYVKTMVNPLGYLKAGFSAGIDQWKDKPQSGNRERPGTVSDLRTSLASIRFSAL
jgi:hypothetical protein